MGGEEGEGGGEEGGEEKPWMGFMVILVPSNNYAQKSQLRGQWASS